MWVMTYLEQHDDVTTLQQDNPRPHSTRTYIMDIRNSANVHVMQWVAYSPDPYEINIGNEMETHL